MTLLELPVKELPKRGGWLAIFRVFPDCNVAEKFISDFKVSYGTDSNCDQYIESEETGEILTREQYEAAIAAQQTVWNGEGLPPVGCECEYETIKDNWRKCRVMYLGEKCNIVRTDEWGEVCCVLSVKFRPIVAEADRKRETSIAAMSEFFGHASGLYDLSGLYEEIAAGKIPGVELTK